mgnify:CR=1 FL=1
MWKLEIVWNWDQEGGGRKLYQLLQDGYEPFAIDQGNIYLRKETKREKKEKYTEK